MAEALANIMFCHPGLHFMKMGMYLNTLLSTALGTKCGTVKELTKKGKQ
jgi:hypothetical protein